MLRIKILLFFCYTYPSILFASVNQNFWVFEEAGKKGVKNHAGEIVIPATYEAMGWSNGEFSAPDGVTGYRLDGYWGLISLKNKPVTDPLYSTLRPAAGNLLVASRQSKFSHRHFQGLINFQGKVIIPFQYERLQVEGLRVIAVNEVGQQYLYGVVDMSNKTIIPFSYRRIYALNNLRYAVENGTGKKAIFTDQGKQITEFVLDSIDNFFHNLAIFYQDHQQGLIDITGEKVVEPLYKAIEVQGPEAVRGIRFGKWHVLNSKNQQFGEFLFDAIQVVDPGVYQVSKNGKVWLMDSTGADLTPMDINYLGPIQHGLMVFRKDEKFGFLKKDGSQLLPARFDSAYLENGFLYAKRFSIEKDSWMLYDTLGIQRTNLYYEKIGVSKGSYLPVKRKGHWGIMDPDGEEIIPCVYDSIYDVKPQRIAVKFHGEYGVIDTQENWILLPQPDPVQIIDDQYYLLRRGILTQLRSFDSTLVYFTENPVMVKTGYLLERLSSGKFWKIDLQGRIQNLDDALNGGFEEIREPSEGFYGIKKDGMFGFIDADNKLRIANRYQDVGRFREGFAAIRIRDRWGFIDKYERIVIQPYYDQVGEFQNGLAVVKLNGKTGLINQKGESVLKPQYSTITFLANGRIVLEQEGKYGMADRKGIILINPRYEFLRDLDNDFLIAGKRGKYGLITFEGVNTIPMIYSQLVYDPFSNRYFAEEGREWEDVEVKMVSD